MSDEEIKGNNIPNNVLQALGDLTNGAINYYQLPKTTLEEENIILNYITNLQKENEKLKETLQTDKLMKAFMVEHNRNEKAVEYIKSHNPSDIGICGNNKKYYYTLNEDSVDNVLNILQGGDE